MIPMKMASSGSAFLLRVEVATVSFFFGLIETLMREKPRAKRIEEGASKVSKMIETITTPTMMPRYTIVQLLGMKPRYQRKEKALMKAKAR